MKKLELLLELLFYIAAFVLCVKLYDYRLFIILLLFGSGIMLQYKRVNEETSKKTKKYIKSIKNENDGRWCYLKKAIDFYS